MQFLFPMLVAGFLFLAVPPLVHLINMLRHRRQQWAAMEFLLASYRKQKKWIILRQLLLLLSRIGIAAALIAMLAGWTGGSAWLDVLGGQTTHHVVILDDSYSMADTSGGATAYSRALAALDGMARRLSTAEGRHQLTVLRASRAGLIVRGGSDSGDAAADISAIDLAGDLRSVERVMATNPSPLADDTASATSLAADLMKATAADRNVLYMMSDFRRKNWQSPERAKQAMDAVARQGAEIRLIDCSAPEAQNLGIVALEPIPDVWVAGVPVVVKLTVRNFGSNPIRNVNVAARIIRYGSAASTPDPTVRFSGVVESLPSIVFEQIPAGEEQTKQFQVYIAENGTHAIEVQLPEDTLAVDNRRMVTLPLSEVSKVLVVDGDPEERGAYLVSSVLQPGGQVQTGAIPESRPPSFLRSARAEDLAEYRAIYLIDLPEVDSASADALRTYVAGGGGLMWMLGPAVQASRYNEVLLRPGADPLLPGRLTEVVPLDRSGATNAPDMTLGPRHPLMDPLTAIGEAVFALVRLQRSYGIELDTERAGPVSRLIQRRDGDPLVLQHDLGAGRVVTSLTSLDNDWTNWNADPTFVVFMLRANAYLWSSATKNVVQSVDDPIEIKLPSDQYARAVTYMTAVDEPPRVPIEEQATVEGDLPTFRKSAVTSAIDGKSDVPALLQPGLSEYWLTRLDGTPEVRLVASAVEPNEGNLERSARGDIRRALQPNFVTFYSASDVIANEQTAGGGLLSMLLLALLASLLGIEQVLAYFASYHPPTAGGKS